MSSHRLGVAAAVLGGRLVPGDVEIADGRVAAAGLGSGAPGGAVAVPGLVDLQVNGSAGIDVAAAGPEELHALGAALLRTGTCAWLPTRITGAPRDMAATLSAIGVAAALPGTGSARILGAHLEGPFVAPGRLGAHPAAHRRDPDATLLHELLAAGPVALVTLAPELPGALELIGVLRAHGIAVSIGHTDASAAQAHAAFAAGASSATHLPNAMAPLHHREPGPAGAALATPGITVGLIADGVHVADELLRIVCAAARGRVALVSDAVAAAGAPDGASTFAGVRVVARDGVVRTPDGVLAGSAHGLDAGLRRLVALGVPLAEAVHAVTAAPAALLRRTDVGRLEIGGPADLCVLDEHLEVARVLLGGREVHAA